MRVTLALLGLGSVAALQLGGSARSHAVQLSGARAQSRTSRVICGWGPDPVWSALEVGSIKDAAEGLKAITIKPADGAADAFTVAGQYVQIREPGAEKAGIFAIASSPTKAGDFEFLIKEQPASGSSSSSPSLNLSLSPSLSPRLTLTPTLTLALALTSSEWSPGTGWLTDAKAGLALEMSQVMGPGFKIDGVLDDVDSVLLFAVGSGISPIRSGMP
jgi:ferredoxin-NADP reductase